MAIGTTTFLAGLAAASIAILMGTRLLRAPSQRHTAAIVAIVLPAEVRCPACDLDPAVVSLTGIQVGQAIVATLAVLAAGDEYSTGLVHITLAAMPHRTTVLVAKAAVRNSATGPGSSWACCMSSRSSPRPWTRSCGGSSSRSGR